MASERLLRKRPVAAIAPVTSNKKPRSDVENKRSVNRPVRAAVVDVSFRVLMSGRVSVKLSDVTHRVECGRGGESIVFSGRWRGGKVAVKLSQKRRQGRNWLAHCRFTLRREAAVLQLLSASPNVPKWYATLHNSRGLVLEFVPGVTIESLWRNLPGATGPDADDKQELQSPLPSDAVLELLKQVCVCVCVCGCVL
jgi:serine/threonine protein kinase